MLNVLDKGYISVRNGIYKFFRDEKGEVNIVTIVILIGIAVALAVIFKDKVEDLVKTILDAVTKKGKEAAGVK